MALLSKPWGIRPVLLGLSTHFVIWWIVSIWLWTRFNWKLWQEMALIGVAPSYFGVLYLRSAAFRVWGAGGMLAFLALIAMTFLSIRTRKRWVVLLTHFAVLFYWFVGFAVIAIGD